MKKKFLGGFVGFVFFAIMFIMFFLMYLYMAKITLAQIESPEPTPIGPPTPPGQPSTSPPSPPGPPGILQPQILAAFFNCTPIDTSMNATIIVQVVNIEKINITVFSNISTNIIDFNNVIPTNGMVIINLTPENYSLLLPRIGGDPRPCNETTNCFIYFTVYSEEVPPVNSSNNLTVWLEGIPSTKCVGVVPPPPLQLPIPTIITPSEFCIDSGQNVCCNVTGNEAHYYNASQAIWHNGTILNWQSGWNWTWEGKSPGVSKNLTNTSNDISKINLTHTYGLKSNVNTTNLPILLEVSNRTFSNITSVIIHLSNCQVFQPIVKIIHPTSKSTFTHGDIQHNATVIDPDTSINNINFTWVVLWKEFNHIYIRSSKVGNPNMTFAFNYTGNFTSILTARENLNNVGVDNVEFTVINSSCNCSNPTWPCRSWKLDKRENRYCNKIGKWKNFCLTNAQCNSNEYCDKKNNICKPQPGFCDNIDRNLGCSAYTDESNCTLNTCNIQLQLPPPECNSLTGTCIIYFGCSWDDEGSECKASTTTYSQSGGAGETTCFETVTVNCPEAGGKGTITRTYTGTNCPSTITQEITCPTPISYVMPGWSIINVVAVILLLVLYYAFVLSKARQKKRR